MAGIHLVEQVRFDHCREATQSIMSIVAEDYQELQAELSIADLPQESNSNSPPRVPDEAPVVSREEPAPADMECMTGHCMHCKEGRDFKPARIVKRKVGTDIVLGPCKVCGTTVSRIRADKDAKPKSPDAPPKAKKTPSPKKAAAAGKKRSPKTSPAEGSDKPKKKRSPPAKKQKKESSEDDEVTVKGDKPKKKRSPKKAAAAGKKAAPSKRASLTKKVSAMERRGKAE
jgi:hypothetical protein